MRKLNRDAAEIPGCLSGFSHREHSWDDIGVRKTEIHASLEQMQRRWCAYCEGSLDSLGSHIEHFRRRRDFPGLTFAWSNLYWSCDQHDSCGRHKDHGAGDYTVDLLIDPCVDDPDRFFLFRSDGTISIRKGLEEADRRRAEETLRVFSLDAEWGRLRRARENVIKKYQFFVDNECKDRSPDFQQMLAQILTIAEGEPFFTAIRHVLTET